MASEFLEILFEDALREGDLEILRVASFEEPGAARLVGAYTGRPHPQAPNSRPLLSAVGEKIGFVAAGDLIEAPYSWSYWIE